MCQYQNSTSNSAELFPFFFHILCRFWIFLLLYAGDDSSKSAAHLFEHFFFLMGNAHQLLNKAIWKVPTQQIRYQQRLLKGAPTQQRGKKCGKNKQLVWRKGKIVVAMETKKERNGSSTNIMTRRKKKAKLSQKVSTFLTEAGSGCPAEPGQHGRYTETECY